MQEIGRLKERVTQLESALGSASSQRQGTASGNMTGMGSGGMMEMMNSMMGGMQGMPGPQQGVATPHSSLPGFPGLSHLYHIGSTGFFLDHSQMIQLSAEQQAAISQVRDKALAERTNSSKRIRQAEGELWQLTSQDAPDLDKIETMVRDIEKTRAERRIRFIRRVGQAAQLLTDRQRSLLLRGHGASYGDPASSANPGTAGAMGHM